MDADSFEFLQSGAKAYFPLFDSELAYYGMTLECGKGDMEIYELLKHTGEKTSCLFLASDRLLEIFFS
jgi:hypothetical protein